MAYSDLNNLSFDLTRNIQNSSANGSEGMNEEGRAVRYVVMSISLLLTSVVCSASNALICCVIIRAKLYHSAFHATLFVLHAGGWALGILGSVVASCMVQSAKCVLSEPLCTMYGFVIAWSGIGCIFSIAVISYEWYRKLICLSRSRNSRANWHIVVRLGSIWFASFVVTCPPLFGWNRYTVEGYAMPCSVDWESTLLTDRLYVAYMFTLGLFIPLAVVLFSYGNIIRIMRTIADRRATSCPHMAAFVSRHHIRMMQMLFAMLLAFCITWIPYGIHCLIIVFGHKKILSEDGAIFIMMLAKASIGTYPVIYACMNNEIQNAFKAWSIRGGC